MVAKMITKIAMTVRKFISEVFTKFTVPPIALGMPETMPAKMIRLIPLPIPRCVICSPIHISSMVPVSIDTAEIAINKFISIMIACSPPRPLKL